MTTNENKILFFESSVVLFFYTLNVLSEIAILVWEMTSAFNYFVSILSLEEAMMI